MKRKKVNAQDAGAVDPTVARAPSHFHLRESRLAQKSLAQTFESIYIHGSEDIK